MLKDIKLSEQENLDPEDPDVLETMDEILSQEVEGMIETLRKEWMKQPWRREQDREEDFPLPLIRIRVDHTGFPKLNIQRFGAKFVGRVANPEDLLLHHKQRKIAVRSGAAEAGLLLNRDGGLLADIHADPDGPPPIHEMVSAVLSQSNQRLSVLSDVQLGRAVAEYVEKHEAQAITNFVEEALGRLQLDLDRDKEIGTKGREQIETAVAERLDRVVARERRAARRMDDDSGSEGSSAGEEEQEEEEGEAEAEVQGVKQEGTRNRRRPAQRRSGETEVVGRRRDGKAASLRRVGNRKRKMEALEDEGDDIEDDSEWKEEEDEDDDDDDSPPARGRRRGASARRGTAAASSSPSRLRTRRRRKSTLDLEEIESDDEEEETDSGDAPLRRPGARRRNPPRSRRGKPREIITIDSSETEDEDDLAEHHHHDDDDDDYVEEEGGALSRPRRASRRSSRSSRVKEEAMDIDGEEAEDAPPKKKKKGRRAAAPANTTRRTRAVRKTEDDDFAELLKARAKTSAASSSRRRSTAPKTLTQASVVDMLSLDMPEGSEFQEGPNYDWMGSSFFCLPFPLPMTLFLGFFFADFSFFLSSTDLDLQLL